MKIKNNAENVIIILCFISIISFFWIPKLIIICKLYLRLHDVNIKIENFGIQKLELKKKYFEKEKVKEDLHKQKEKEISKLKELAKIINLYKDTLYEEKADNNLYERTVNLMESLINNYEKNNNQTKNIIKELSSYFKNNSLTDYINNKSNILMISSIIKNESDIDFIYNNLLPSFFLKNSVNDKYNIFPPCFKASIDTNNNSIFHKKCNNVGNTLMLIKTNKTRFGGITELSWSQKNVKTPKVFNTRTLLFNLNNKKIFKYNKKQNVSKYISPISGDNFCFAIFGYKDIYLDYLPKDSYSNFPSQFLKNKECPDNYNELLDEKINDGNNIVRFEYEEIEVYPISLSND